MENDSATPKSGLSDRITESSSQPSTGVVFSTLEKRTQTHIFLCVLAYHLLVAIEKRFLDRGVHTSWWTLREQLRTHQVVTVVLPTKDGKVLKVRKGTTPEPMHREIYSTLQIPTEVMKPVKTWHEPAT